MAGLFRNRSLLVALLSVMFVCTLGATLAPRAYADPLADAGDAVMQFLGLADEPQTAAAFDESKVADPATYTTWEGIAGQNTENIGRIWTDKTVATENINLPGGVEPMGSIGDSDFLVMLSALSSSSNLVSSTGKPLDIVLVLDASGSMDDDMTTYSYNPAYDVDINRRNSYYALVDGEYVEIKREGNGFFGYHWELNGQKVTPKTSADDSNGIQFYTRSVQRMTRMEALQDAANEFIVATAQKNDTISDPTDQHRISVVKFADDSYNYSYGDAMTGQDYNYTQRLNPLTAYTSDTVSTLTTMVSGLQAAGATSADYGMTMANKEFADNNRADAQKVVIFFTDGEPNHSNGFDGTVAVSAIAQAKTVKDAGGLVYTIGVFAGADSSSLNDRTNRYMQAMSSNYPNAMGYEMGQLGSRNPDKNADYYKAASDASSLNTIFDDIFSQITTGSGSPTYIEEGADANNSGYVTFTDELGAYMQVDGFKEIIFADKTFTPTNVVTEGNITTYTYTGEVQGGELYPNADMSRILIQVEKGASLADGDVVTVKIPASMLPMRHFKANTENGTTTMTVSDTYLLRVFYGVSLKPEVEETLANGIDNTPDDQALEAYIAANTPAEGTDAGKTAFYSNLYDGSNALGNTKLGNTTARFVPSKTNTFYYFTEDTPLYTDPECTRPLKLTPGSTVPEGETYYYKREFIAIVDAATNAAEVKSTVYQFDSANLNTVSSHWSADESGQAYMKAGSPRLTRVDSTTSAKTDNATSTATEVIDPLWDDPNAPNAINVYLGNNGKLNKELSGALKVTKNAFVDAGLSRDVIAGKDFEFTIKVDGAAGKTYYAEVRDAQGNVLAAPFQVTFSADGTITHSLKDSESLYIYGLDKGASYEVTETGMPKGFELTSVNGQAVSDAASSVAKGAIAAGQLHEAVFANTYKVSPAKVADFAPYQKNFDRWDIEGDFELYLMGDPASPMPAGAQTATGDNGELFLFVKATATQAAPSGAFGEVEFTKPGTYTYNVIEPQTGKTTPGMTYSAEAYQFEVNVADNGDGTLSASTAMYKSAALDGTAIQPAEKVENGTASFTNSFNAASVNDGPGATKVYTDKSGSKPLKSGEFSFEIKPVGANADIAPMPDGATQTESGKQFVAVNDQNTVMFKQATFTAEHVGKTFTYEFRELMPSGATAENGYTVGGMTYDPAVYTVEFEVTAEDVAGTSTVKVVKTYYKGSGDTKTLVADERNVVFHNVYDPSDVTLAGETALMACKTINGRSSLEGESFSFTLSPANTATSNAVDNGSIALGSAGAKTLTTSVTSASDGVPAYAAFDDVTFTQPGAYTFNVVEDAADPVRSGMDYDSSTKRILVEVTDNGGVLEAVVSYDNGQNAGITSAASFVNSYHATSLYGTDMELNVGKTLTGRALESDEFSFAIAGVDKDGSVSAAAADAKLAATDKAFTNAQRADDGVESIIYNKMSTVRFDQSDADKTFSYVISETAGSLPGVTYDTATWNLDITVHDNGDGTLYTTSSISGSDGSVQTFDGSDGKDVAKVAFSNVYTVAETSVDTAAVDLKKILSGRAWKQGDVFEMTIRAIEQAGVTTPMPAAASGVVDNGDGTLTLQVSAPEGTASDTEVPFDFGTITFTEPGTYMYSVSENHAGETIDGVAYEPTTAAFFVTVTDKDASGSHTGQLTAEVSWVEGNVFSNVYSASANQDAVAPITIEKTLTGRDMAEGEFSFQLKALDGTNTVAADAASKAGMGAETTVAFSSVASADGVAATVFASQFEGFVFDLSDAGKTYKYEFCEIGADGQPATGGVKDGVTYDGNVYTLELSASDNGDGTMAVKIVVTDGSGAAQTYESSSADQPVPVVLSFFNTYFNNEDAKDVALLADPTTSVNGKLVGVGDELVYTIDWMNNAVDNNGVPCAADVTITDQVPAGTDFVSAADGGTHANGTVTWNLGEQQPGASGSVSFVVKVNENAVQHNNQVSNQATIQVGATNSQTNVVTNEFPGKTEVTNPSEIDEGTVLTYQIKFKNTDGAEASATVVDSLAKGLEYQPGATVNGVPQEPVVAGDANSAAGTDLTWNLSGLADGAEVVVEFQAKVTIAAMTFVDNQATVNGHASNVVTTPYSGDNEKHAFDASGNTIDGKLVGVGQKLAYEITWVNPSNAANGDVTVVDTLPKGVVLDESSYAYDQVEASSVVYDSATGVVTWTFANQPAGQKGKISFEVEVTGDAVAADGSVTTLQNTASVNGTDVSVRNFVPGKTATEGTQPANDLQVGEELTYAISYMNTEETASDVTITDVLPQGVTYMDGSADNGGSYDAASTTLTWVVKDVAAGASGTVSFKAKVNESALTVSDPVSNTASLTIGKNVYQTNTTPSPSLGTGSLTVSKEIALAEGQGTAVDPDAAFAFKVELKGTDGSALTASYPYTKGSATGALTSGDTIELKHGESVVITGLPEGATYVVTETNANTGGYTVDSAEKSGSVSVEGSTAAFVNTYETTPATLLAADGIKALKELQGRNWSDADQFVVELKALDGAPMPADASNGVLQKTLTKDAIKVEFGDITYTSVGSYSYEITEVVPSDESKIAGITYSKAKFLATVNVTDNGDGTLTAELDPHYVVVDRQDGSHVEDAEVPEAAAVAQFVNTYRSEVPAEKPVSTDNLFGKVLEGRDWLASDSFTFSIEAVDGAPMPEKESVTLVGRTDASGDEVNFGFGTIDFTFDDIKDVEPAADGTRTKAFTYKVTEVVPSDADKIAGITYDTREVVLTVTLTDDAEGNLAATYNVANGPFKNTYDSGRVDVDAAGGVQIVKTMTGRAIAANDFSFTMLATNSAAQEKFGSDAKTFATAGAPLAAGSDANAAVEIVPVATGLTFSLEDAGKEFEFTFSEQNGGKPGYAYDPAEHKLVFAVADDSTTGTLTVKATLDGAPVATWSNTVSRAAGDVVSVPFANSYDAGSVTVGGSGDVALEGVKSLTGRPMVAGEFHFNVVNAAADASGALLDSTVVSIGVNDGSGKVTFGGITYTTEQLNSDVAAGLATVDRAGDADVYTYAYVVTEDASANDEGVTVVSGTQAIKVKVTDDRAGKLSAEVVYPDGGMNFANAYGAGETAEASIAGTKVLNVESGDNAPDITGKYTFTLTASEGAPMPEKTSVTNDAAGNVDFGTVVYTMENVFGDGGQTASSEADSSLASAIRTKTFVYEVTESGNVAGVTNDASHKTIEVTVTDNGDGTLSVAKSTMGQNADFTFVNTYAVAPASSSPTGAGALSVTKTLEGRSMTEGEFEFALTSQGEDMPAVVTATNDAAGTVAFPEIAFTAPGDYKYSLAEVDGKLGGVTYDSTVYRVIAHVVDNGDGTLKVEWSLDNGGKDVAFANKYAADPSALAFTAAKVLTGRSLAEGEFFFELREGGKILQTVANGAPDESGNALVSFDPIEFTEAGEHDFQIVEVKGNAENVTYDETVFTYHVTVVDNGKGQLEVEWTEGDAGAPVFRNAYTAPKDPASPSDPGAGGTPSGSDKLPGPGFAKTNDIVGPLGVGLLALAVASAALIAFGVYRMRKG